MRRSRYLGEYLGECLPSYAGVPYYPVQAWEEQLDGSKLVRYIYKGHDSAYTRDKSAPQAPGGSLLRGNIIGGTALIDDVANKPYPNEVLTTQLVSQRYTNPTAGRRLTRSRPSPYGRGAYRAE